MLRTASLTLCSILGCSSLFAQSKQSLEPFDLPGEVVSKPMYSKPTAARTDSNRLIPASTPTITTTVSPPPQPSIQQTKLERPVAPVNPGDPPTGLFAKHHDPKPDCLDRLSNWFFYRNPRWPHNCGWVPQPFHTPGYAYFYHPTADTTRPCGNLCGQPCTSCGNPAYPNMMVGQQPSLPKGSVSQQPALANAPVANQPATHSSGTRVMVSGIPVLGRPDAREVIDVAKPARPVVPNSSAAMAQPATPVKRNVPEKMTILDEDGESPWYPRVIPPTNKPSNPIGATLPDPK
jgi:hypothetical protein